MSLKPATMRDVAERAEVSKVAVSVVLHGSRSNTRVSDTTRQRILQAAEDLHYTPNSLARALRRRQMNVIGLYLGEKYLDTRSQFISEIVAGLQAGCNEYRKDLLIHGTFRGQSIADIHEELIGGKIDGLALFARQDDPLVLRLVNSSLPVVALADAVTDLPSVVVDDVGGSRMLAEYLRERGHRTILYRKGPETQTSSVRRFLAFREAAIRLGMTVLEHPGPTPRNHDPLDLWEQNALDGQHGPRPTAIACSTDVLATMALESCRSRGLRIPQDVAIVGFDGIVPEMAPVMRLTTIHAPWADVARAAVELIAQRLEGHEMPRETVLPVELVIGETA